MITLNEPALTFVVLQALAAWLSAKRVPPRSSSQTHATQLARLATLSIQDLHRLAELRPPVAGIEIDTHRLHWAFGALDDAERLGRQRDHFICKGASNVLMRRLFKLDDRTTRRLRRLYHVRVHRGRPRLPSKRLRAAMQARWRSFVEPDLRERYLLLSARFPSWSLDALQQVIHENDAALTSALGVSPKRTSGANRLRSSVQPNKRRVPQGRRT